MRTKRAQATRPHPWLQQPEGGCTPWTSGIFLRPGVFGSGGGSSSWSAHLPAAPFCGTPAAEGSEQSQAGEGHGAWTAATQLGQRRPPLGTLRAGGRGAWCWAVLKGHCQPDSAAQTCLGPDLPLPVSFPCWGLSRLNGVPENSHPLRTLGMHTYLE